MRFIPVVSKWETLQGISLRFFAQTVLLVEKTDIGHPYDLKMKSLFLVETVVLAGFVLVSQVTAKVRPNASGISRIQDGG